MKKLTDGFEPPRDLRQFVAVAHPHVELLRQAVEEGGAASGGTTRRRPAVLAMLARRDASAEDVRQLLFAASDIMTISCRGERWYHVLSR
jgi:hypothetical protein